MSDFNLKSLSRESFEPFLKHIIYDIGVDELLFSLLTPSEPPTSYKLPMPDEIRIDIPLSGAKHMIYPAGNSFADRIMKPGQIHYCPPFTWKLPVWDSSHEMSSVVIKKEFTRITYIKYEHTDFLREPPRASVFYHTSSPMCDAGRSITDALNSLADSNDSDEIKKDMLMTLLKITLREIQKDVATPKSKSYTTYLKIKEYLSENFYYPINRASVATTFNLNPSHLSRLFTNEGNEGFTTTLQGLRMKHSATLLKKSAIPIKEIAEQCGYLSLTSFASTFKKYYGVSPGSYRIINKK